MDTPRTQRLAQEFQQEIALIVQRELKDPHMGFITITRVELSKDLAYAKVFFSCMGDEHERERSQETLGRSGRYIHGLLKKRFRLKMIPRLQFRYDESIAGVIALGEAFEKLKDDHRAS